MKDRIDYRKLLEKWIRYYTIPPERAAEMFEVIWKRLQETKNQTDETIGGSNGIHMERTGRKGEE